MNELIVEDFRFFRGPSVPELNDATCVMPHSQRLSGFRESKDCAEIEFQRIVATADDVDRLDSPQGLCNRCEIKSLTAACQTQCIFTSAGLEVDEPREDCAEFPEVEGVVARCSHDIESLDFGG